MPKKIVIEAVLSVENGVTDWEDDEEVEAFMDFILYGPNLILHSNDIGDSVGSVTVMAHWVDIDDA